MAITPAEKKKLKKKYAEEREKRLRADGNDQYIRIGGKFSHYREDPYLPIKERTPKTDHVKFAFIGGGYAGLVTGARLVEQGINDVRIIEKGGDFGGTWYWNRYPGAQCDIASMVYMPLLEETNHMPSEKYARAPELLEHCQTIGNQFNLYDNALFHTAVNELRWDEDDQVWHILTNRGDNFTSQYVGIGTGILHAPKLPGIDGIEDFKGHSFHTSRWDYAYTGGDASGALMEKLKDKRVALIGTGATAIQCVPHLAKACETFYVCQRTPSSVDVRGNHPTDPKWFEEMATPGWQRRWLENFAANLAGGGAEEDLVQDGWTDMSRRVRDAMADFPKDVRSDSEEMLEAVENSDFEKMEDIRARVESIVADKKTSESLKAWYKQLCKRPCFHDEYLDAFNEPSTILLDTDGKGVDRISEKGVVVQGVKYEVDCIIYATGFEVGTSLIRRAGFETYGRDGITLSQAWSDGMRSKHGIHVRNFPNAFLVQPTQGGNLIINVPHNILESAMTIAMMVRHAEDRGCQTIEVSQQAQDAWIELLLKGPGMTLGSPDCTPGYYNNEGRAMVPQARYAVGYPAGAPVFFRYIKEWRESGDFEGIEFA